MSDVNPNRGKDGSDRSGVEPVVRVEDLVVEFSTEKGRIRAVDGISFSVMPGEPVGIVGESGCGKTVTALSVLKLIPSPPGRIARGQVFLDGKDVVPLGEREMRKLRGNVASMIFQEPMTSLDPLMKIGRQIEETVKLHFKLKAEERRNMALEVMKLVGLPEPDMTYKKYPHQLSGGQRQRAMIAAAFINHPKLLILDEPTTALDVTVQAQIIDLLKRLNEKCGVSLLFISHDLRVIKRVCKKVAVMYNGEIVEYGDTEQVFSDPQHEYTKELVAAVSARRKVNA